MSFTIFLTTTRFCFYRAVHLHSFQQFRSTLWTEQARLTISSPVSGQRRLIRKHRNTVTLLLLLHLLTKPSATFQRLRLRISVMTLTMFIFVWTIQFTVLFTRSSLLLVIKCLLPMYHHVHFQSRLISASSALFTLVHRRMLHLQVLLLQSSARIYWARLVISHLLWWITRYRQMLIHFTTHLLAGQFISASLFLSGLRMTSAVLQQWKKEMRRKLLFFIISLTTLRCSRAQLFLRTVH